MKNRMRQWALGGIGVVMWLALLWGYAASSYLDPDSGLYCMFHADRRDFD